MTESPLRRMAKERLEAMESLWWCVAWNHVKLAAKLEAPVNRTNFWPVERSAREVPLIRTVSYEKVGLRPPHAKMNLLSSPTLPNR